MSIMKKELDWQFYKVANDLFEAPKSARVKKGTGNSFAPTMSRS